MSYFTTSHFFVSILLVLIVIFSNYCQVEAKQKQVISVPGWFNSVEEYVIHKLNERPSESSRIVIPKDNSEKIKPRKTKKRKQTVNKIVHSFQDGMPIDITVKETKKRKKKRKNARRFVKTVGVRNADSNLSESPEKTKRKPMDIIVHIKMNE